MKKDCQNINAISASKSCQPQNLIETSTCIQEGCTHAGGASEKPEPTNAAVDHENAGKLAHLKLGQEQRCEMPFGTARSLNQANAKDVIKRCKKGSYVGITKTTNCDYRLYGFARHAMPKFTCLNDSPQFSSHFAGSTPEDRFPYTEEEVGE